MQESASSHEFSRIFFPPLHKPHLTTLLSMRNQTPSTDSDAFAIIYLRK